MLYLQGGPGFECRSPQNSGFTNTILGRGYQLLFLDQRGTGLSSPVSASTLAARCGDDPAAQAAHLRLFRADSIVRDCEAVRRALTRDFPAEKRRWSVMGQSFGGFCATTYLSLHPEALREAFLFGGLPPLARGPDDVYARLYRRAARRNEAYYAKFPEDTAAVRRIVRFLDGGERGEPVRVPSGGRLSGRRFLQLGVNFGSHGGLDAVHYVVLRADAEIQGEGVLTRKLLATVEGSLPQFDANPLYAVLHEPIYCQGTAARWSAERMRAGQPGFGAGGEGEREGEGGGRPLYFTGEMVYPWMLEDYDELAKMAEPARLVAETDDWPDLYDEGRLARNEVPVYAAVYVDDMYVDFDYSMETAGKIKRCKTFVTNMMYHDAIRSKMTEVTNALFALRDDSLD